MVYWLVVLTVWFVSLFLTAFGGVELFRYIEGKAADTDLYLGLGTLSLGILLNFLVVNWPTGGAGPSMDEKTLKALRIMAKVAPLAPKAVKKGLEKIVSKYS